MKKLFLLAGLLIPAAGFCQTYTIDWYKIAGGGGTSTNGSFSVSGTMGQQDAGLTMNGGAFSLTGGFWSLIALMQTPGSPFLSINKSGNNVIVSWPYPSAGFILQQNNNLSTTNWVTSGFTVTTNSLSNSVNITPPTGHLFFRLANP